MHTALLIMLAGAQAQDPQYDGAADAADAVAKPVTKLSAELGGSFTAGNANSIAASGGLTGSHRWGQNQFGFGAGVILNLAVVDTDGDGTTADEVLKYEWASQKIFGNVRYDRFFGEKNSLFVAGVGERDPFAGIDFRFNQQLGYARILVDTDKTDLNIEAGLAYTEEGYTATPDIVLDDHYLAARVYLGFGYVFNESVNFTDTIEMYENFFSPADFRLINTATLSARLSKTFSVKLSHRLAFDNQPVEIDAATGETFRKLDHTTMLTLVASIF